MQIIDIFFEVDEQGTVKVADMVFSDGIPPRVGRAVCQWAASRFADLEIERRAEMLAKERLGTRPDGGEDHSD